MPAQVTHIFFHSPCFDGIVSAVLCWDFLESQRGAAKVRLHAVGYEIKRGWPQKSLPDRSAVVDFLFHPDAELWADHHATSFLRESDRSYLTDTKSAIRIYDSGASSCAALMRSRLRRSFGYRNPKYDALIEWADRIDSASYRDVKQALLAPNAALQISMSLLNAEDAYCEQLVRELKVRSLSAVARSAVVQRRVRAARASLKAGLRQFARGARLDDGEIVVFDVDARKNAVSRYAPYYFYPDARYSVGVTRLGEGAKITAMRNPWRRFASVPLGPIVARYGGGGHQRVGSVLLKGKAEKRAGDVLIELVKEIREQDQAGRA